MPRFRSPHRAPDWLRQRPIAHRGLHDDERPENSLAAFEAAATADYPIELDVRCSADGRAVVFHDSTLERMTGRPGTVAATPLAELTTLRLGASEQTIPSLDGVLAQVAGRVPVLIELKPADRVGPLERAVCDVLARQPGDYAVQSFDPFSMIRMRKLAPDLPRGLLSGNMRDEPMPLHHKLALRNLALAPQARPHFIGYELWSLPYWAPSHLRRRGLPLVAWTVRDEAGLARARLVADNVIFEHVRP
ncbi:MAG: glycerophosphodiester phosphodiesterase family protein [Myxococcota bacterium]